MLFQRMTALLAISASVLAHPRSGKYRHHLKPSGSGNIIASTGGLYGLGNSTSAYGPTGTGFATGTSAVPTEIVPGSSIDTAIAPASSDLSSCVSGSESTTTIYATELVTMTVTAESTITVKTSTGLSGLSAVDSVDSSAPVSTIATSTEDTEETETSSAAPSYGTTSELPGVSEASASTIEAASAAPYGSSVALVSSDGPSATSSPPVETTRSPTVGSEPSQSSSTMNAPGQFYQASQSPSDDPSTLAPSVMPSSPKAADAVDTADASVESAAPSIRSSGNGKRGLAYNSAALTHAFAGTPMTWAYNWAAAPYGNLNPGTEFCPMLWGAKAFNGWDAAVKAALASGAKHLLSFNEPDLHAQANMDSATAAAAHIKYMNPYAGQAKIGSPAITNGGPSGGTDGMGLSWMQNFFDKCAGKCKVDFLAFHWYDSASNIAYFKNYIKSVIDMAKKNGVSKVWLTEFAASGSKQEIAKFLGEVLPWLDSIDEVERYAYFMCADGHLVSGTSISDPVGKAYAA